MIRPSLSLAVLIASACVLASPGEAQTVITKTSGFGGMGTITTAGAAGSQMITIPANAGQQSGSNLFHSFTQFDVGQGDTAMFTPTGSTSAINNIIARIYSATPSSINGNISVDAIGNFSGANLFLINPKGVIFGANSSVNVPGDFVVSSASYIKLSDGTGVFYSDPTNPSSGTDNLTSAPVSSFGFFKGTTPGDITVNGGANFTVGGSLQFAGGGFTATGGSSLSVSSATLGVFSGGVASGGTDATVPYLTGSTPDYSGAANFANYGHVTLGDSTGGATLSATGTNGSVVIRGGQLVQQGAHGLISASSKVSIRGDSLAVGTTLAPGGTISTGTGTISIDTTGDVTMAGGSITSTSGAITLGQMSLVNLTLDGTSSIKQTAGSGALLSINSTGTVSNGGSISTTGSTNSLKITASQLKFTTGSGVSGSLTASGGSVMLGTSANPLGSLSLDSGTSVTNTGAGTLAIVCSGAINNSGTLSTATGALNIDTTGDLTLTGGAITSAGGPITLGQTRLGSLTLDSMSTISNASGSGGLLKIVTTGTLTSAGTISTAGTAQDVQISAKSLGLSGTISTQSGAITINTTNAMSLTGGMITATGAVNLGQTSLTDLTLDDASTISAVGGSVTIISRGNIQLTGDPTGTNVAGGFIESTGTGSANAGDVNITDTTGNMTLTQGAEIASINTGSGNAGNINLNSGSSVANSAKLLTITGTGVATTNSGIFSIANGTGNAGAINITALGSVALSAGGQIATIASNTNGGTAGGITLNLNADPSTLTLGGISANATTPVPIIYSFAANPVKADGNVTINALISSIELQPGAAIQTSSQDAHAGNISIEASSLTLDADSAIQSLMSQTNSADDSTSGATGAISVLVLNPFEFDPITFSFAGPLTIADTAFIQTVAHPNTTAAGFDPVGQVTVFAGSLTEGGVSVPQTDDGFDYAYKVKGHTDIRMFNSATSGAPNGIDAGTTGSPVVANLLGFPNNNNDGSLPTPPAGDGLILDGALLNGTPDNVFNVTEISPTLSGSTYVYTIDASDGVTTGNNLFLSFSDFDLGINHPDSSNPTKTGVVSEEALFNDSSVSNILVRVTGGKPSEINGELAEADGTNANLFFLNPSGVIFSTNASLALNSAFTVSTANDIQLGGGGTFFSAIDPSDDSVIKNPASSALFAGPVTAFGFNVTAPATMPGAVTIDTSTLSNNNATDGQIQIIAGNITFGDGALLNASQTLLFSAGSSGTLQFSTAGSLALFPVTPSITSAEQVLTDTSFSSLGTINLAGDSVLTVPSPNNASTIVIRAKNFNLTNSLIVDQTTAQAGSHSGQVVIDVTGTLAITGATDSSFISTSTLGSSNGGTIQINAANLTITGDQNDVFTSGILSTAEPENYYTSDSGYIPFAYGSAPTATGSAGNINVDVSGQINLSSFGQISANTNGFGTGGTIIIGALGGVLPQLTVNSGGSISSSTVQANAAFGTTGRAGQVTINASSLTVSDNPSLIATSAGTVLNPGSTGDGGNVSLTVTGQANGGNGDITISDGGQISASSYNNGRGGVVTATQTNSTDGVNINGDGSTSSTGIFAAEFGTGSSAGINQFAIKLTTASPLMLTAGGEISTSAGGNGSSGPITITSGNLTIDGTGADVSQQTGILSSSTGTTTAGFNSSATGNGGNITVNVTGDLGLDTGGAISASSQTVGQAGTVTVTQTGSTDITDPALNPTSNGGLYINGGTISTAANGTGTTHPQNLLAGDIKLNTQALTMNGGSITSNTTGLSKAGDITINGINPGQSSQFLFVQNAGKISSNTGGAGNGGAISVTTNLLTMTGTGSTISTNAVAGTGNGGSIGVTAPVVTVKGGATISSDTSSAGNGGTLTIRVGSLSVDGASSAISTSATAGTGGGGSIGLTVTGNANVAGSTGDVVVTNGGAISASSQTTGEAGTISITQSASQDITDPTLNPATNGGIYLNGGLITTAANGTGTATPANASAGNITLKTQALTLTGSSVILSSTSGLSKAGEVTIGGSVPGTNTQFVVLQNGAKIASETGSPNGVGAGGTITIGTGSLLVDASSISTNATAGIGSAGDISITAASIDPAVTPFVTVQDAASIMSESDGTGSAGMISIHADKMTITGQGSAISTDAGTIGKATNTKGEIMLTGNNLTISQSGLVSATTGGLSPGGSITATISNAVAISFNGKIDASSTAASGGGNGGSVVIGTPVGTPDYFGIHSPETVSLSYDSVISSDSQNTNGGNIAIHTDQFTADSGSLISTNEPNGASTTVGGNITVEAGYVFYLNDGSFVNSNAGQGTGGNILIDPEFTVLNHSGINAIGGLMNGNVTIDTTYLFSGQSLITATGTVSIDSVPLDLNGSLVALPANLTDEEKRLREKCARAVNHEFSSLIVVGRGGTESGPEEFQPDFGFDAEAPAPAKAPKNLR